jgi:hypothetical protein
VHAVTTCPYRGKKYCYLTTHITWLNIIAATLYMDFNVLRCEGPNVALRSSKHSSNSGSARWYAPATRH